MNSDRSPCAPATSLKAPQPATAVSFTLPESACDCHTHIHGDAMRFPLFSGRLYTPGPASPDEMAALHQALGIQRVVIVTPSIYGSDNSATLWGMAARGADARGVAVIADATPESELDAMHTAGIRGIRLNLHTGGTADPVEARRRLIAAGARVKARGWHIQIYTNLAMITALHADIVASPVTVVLDHFGGADAALGVEQAGFSVLLELLRSGNVYVKICGAYRSSTLAPDYADCAALARALIAANPDRVVWGTDWPHPDSRAANLDLIKPFQTIDDGLLLNQFALWAPDAELRQKILVDNPARLYGF